jgi:hypothetical protein
VAEGGLGADDHLEAIQRIAQMGDPCVQQYGIMVGVRASESAAPMSRLEESR